MGDGGSRFAGLTEAYHWGSRWAAIIAHRALSADYRQSGFLNMMSA
jgi:hypothetical protein